ncbi:right-handed parallel beta-helix repeat-containing protein [Chryseobacterium daeguense]|uniref:right-handed parallel beta-helix repeat-containing protein n=1 Tax=Chryseobacterium daeguense TaxID=412438 RepID=UPI0004079874|nr:right-handed parallel beta-helix repeat-containing protein [Chryseobacterium daeguense]
MIYTNDFFQPGSIFPNDDVVQLVDSYTYENVIYKKTTVGVPPSGNGDGAIYRKKGNDFYKRQWTGYVNILWWGIGDASFAATDVTSKIQTALTLGYDIFFDEISIQINDQLFVQDNQKLFSKGCIIKQLGIEKPIFNCEYRSNISITGFKLEGLGTNYSPTSSSEAVGVLCFGAQNLTVENNSFKDFTYSAVSGLRDVNHFTFKYNKVENSFDDAWAANTSESPFGRKDNTGITVGGKNITIFKNSFKNSSQGIIIAEDSEFVSVTDNDIENTILEHGMYLDVGISNLTVSENRIRNTKKMGIKLQNQDASYTVNYTCKNVVISNNIIDNTGGGGDGILIINTTTGILIAKNVVVNGNVIRNAGQHGINIRNVDGAIVSNNMINNIEFCGIYLSHTTTCEVSNNIIKSTKENGILIESDNNFLNINFNIIENPGIKNTGNEGLLTGIKISEVNNVEIAIKHNKIRSNDGFMRWGVFVEGGAGQTTYEIENNTVLNPQYIDFRFIDGTKPLRFLRNNYKNIENSPGQQS